MKKALLAVAAILVAAAIVIPAGINAIAAAYPPAPAATAVPAQRDRDAERHPHMSAAIQHLEQAKAELEKAHPDFAGYRLRALEATKTALRECHEGVESLRRK